MDRSTVGLAEAAILKKVSIANSLLSNRVSKSAVITKQVKPLGKIVKFIGREKILMLIMGITEGKRLYEYFILLPFETYLHTF